MSQEKTQVLFVCQHGLLGLAMACHGSFLSCCEENDPDPKSGWDPDPDKPVCATSCWGDVTDTAFLRTFCGFRS